MSNPQKICVVCGQDCSTITRYQSPDGGYYCHPCYERLLQQAQQAAPASVAGTPPPPPGLRVASSAPAPAAPAVRSRPGPRPPARSVPRASFPLPLAVGGGVLLVFVLLLILTRFVPIIALAYLAGAILFAFGVGVAVLVSAFRTSLSQGFLTFFVPFYALYYVFGVSKSRLLMTLTPLCLVLGFGFFLLPGGDASFEFASEPTTNQSTAAGEGSSTPQTAPELSEGQASKRMVAGHSVTIAPRAYLSSYSKLSAGKQLTVKSDGKRITLRSDQPLHAEQWEVGNQNVMIVNNELIVNYRNYGTLDPGAEVLVNQGKVFVGGKPATEQAGAVQISVSP